MLFFHLRKFSSTFDCFIDLKKLVKYEQKAKDKTTIPKHHPRMRHAPENIINVTIVKESSPKKIHSDDPTTKTKKSITASIDDSAPQNETTDQPVAPAETKESKQMFRLPKHIKTRNPKIVYKKGAGKRNGVLIRNTPTDLYQKYQEDWTKFKAFIPGESDRMQVRQSIRRKMHHKDNDDNAKVIFIFFMAFCSI